ncbi:TetR/AcrR family transcriptional regulator [Actinocatenispora sera]|uniref:TetR/AcrR family transcriptional regulator n=1 Tax=Actinocatenispora sera TaxID=390989 RepID=UPI0033FDA8A2
MAGEKSGGKTARAPRADAQRNRDKLVRAARVAFTDADGPVPLEDIARAAGVGVGTLYRNFPTREALVEAVYASELAALTDSADELLQRHPPDVALRAWMGGYARFFAAKRGMADTLRAGWASGRIATPNTRERLSVAMGRILAAGAAAGVLRADADPYDVTTMLLGSFLATASGDNAERIDQMLDLLVDALRPPRS